MKAGGTGTACSFGSLVLRSSPLSVKARFDETGCGALVGGGSLQGRAS